MRTFAVAIDNKRAYQATEASAAHLHYFLIALLELPMIKGAAVAVHTMLEVDTARANPAVVAALKSPLIQIVPLLQVPRLPSASTADGVDSLHIRPRAMRSIAVLTAAVLATVVSPANAVKLKLRCGNPQVEYANSTLYIDEVNGRITQIWDANVYRNTSPATLVAFGLRPGECEKIELRTNGEGLPKMYCTNRKSGGRVRSTQMA